MKITDTSRMATLLGTSRVRGGSEAQNGSNIAAAAGANDHSQVSGLAALMRSVNASRAGSIESLAATVSNGSYQVEAGVLSDSLIKAGFSYGAAGLGNG